MSIPAARNANVGVAARRRTTKVCTTMVDTDWKHHFISVRDLGSGKQGSANMVLAKNVIPKKPTSKLTQSELDDLKNSVRVVKVHHNLNNPDVLIEARQEINTLKKRLVNSLIHTSRITSHAKDFSWFAGTWAGATANEIILEKDQRHWWLPQRLCWEVLRQGLEALVHLHSGNDVNGAVAHRDLCLQNVCLQIVSGEGEDTCRPRIHLSFIDFGHAWESDSTNVKYRWGSRRDMGVFSEFLHDLAHPEPYYAHDDPEWGDRIVRYDAVNRTYCQCSKMLRVNRRPRSDQIRLRENCDRDLTHILDFMVDPTVGYQLTAEEALDLLNTKYAHKFEDDYEIPEYLFNFIHSKIPTEEEIRNAIDTARDRGDLRKVAATDTGKAAELANRNLERPRIFTRSYADWKTQQTLARSNEMIVEDLGSSEIGKKRGFDQIDAAKGTTKRDRPSKQVKH